MQTYITKIDIYTLYVWLKGKHLSFINVHGLITSS